MEHLLPHVELYQARKVFFLLSNCNKLQRFKSPDCIKSNHKFYESNYLWFETHVSESGNYDHDWWWNPWWQYISSYCIHLKLTVEKKILLRTFFNVKEGNDMKIRNRCHIRFSNKDTYRKWGLDGHVKIQNRSWVSILIVIASSSRTIMLIWLIMIASLMVGNFFFGIRILLFDFCGSHGCSFIHNSSCAVLALLSVSWYRVFLFSDSFIPDQMKDFFPSHAIWSFFCFGFNSPS